MGAKVNIRGPHRILGSQEILILLAIRRFGVASIKEVQVCLNTYVDIPYLNSGVHATIYRMEEKGWVKTSKMDKYRYVCITESGHMRLHHTLQCIATLQNL